MGDKQIEKLRKGIEDYRRSAGRFRIDVAEEAAQRIATYLLAFDGIEQVTPAGSLRRGRETAGDLDLLVTGPACAAGTYRRGRRIRRRLSRHPQTSSPRAKTRSASISATACRWTCACCLRSPTAPRCNTSPAPRRTTSRCASALSRWATRSASGRWRGSTTTQPLPRPPKKRFTPRSAWTGCPRSCARTWAKSKPPPSTPCPGSSS